MSTGEGAVRGFAGEQPSSGPPPASAPPAQAGWDALVLQSCLARLPPAQPCLACRSHDAHDELVSIAPQLEKSVLNGVDEYRAVFACTLCGAERRTPLRP